MNTNAEVNAVNEETKRYYEERKELRRIYDEEISPMIVLGDYEGARNLLNRNPDIKFFLEPSQFVKMYDYLDSQCKKIPWDLGDDE